MRNCQEEDPEGYEALFSNTDSKDKLGQAIKSDDIDNRSNHEHLDVSMEEEREELLDRENKARKFQSEIDSSTLLLSRFPENDIVVNSASVHIDHRMNCSIGIWFLLCIIILYGGN